MHYEKKLKLTQEEMNFHLPKTLKTSNLVYEIKNTKNPQQNTFTDNANYLITQQTNVPIVIINPNMNPNTIRRSVSPEHFVQAPNQSYRNPYPVIQQN